MFDVPRIPVVRQKAVGDDLAALLPAGTEKNKVKSPKLPEDVVTHAREVVDQTRALESIVTLPKLTIDNVADRVYGGFFKLLLGEEQCLDGTLSPLTPALESRRRAAARVRARAFPKKVSFLKIEMNLQYRGMRDVVRALRSEELAGDVKTLGLAAHVDHLEAQLAPYGVAVSSPDGTDIEKLSDGWHAAFVRFTGAVIARWPAGDPTREALLKPYQRELDAHREDQAAARAATKKRKAPTS